MLNFKGYYIKVAQTLCGVDFLPEAYEEAFAPLVDSCPSEPFSVVKAIVESELQAPI